MKKNFLALGTCAFALALGLVACDDSTSANGSSGDENPVEDSCGYQIPNIDYGEFTDERDGQVYKTVTIGTQTWMAENLNYEPGDVSGMGSYAWSGCHNNEADSCVKYGRLYTWSAAMNACPYGWHLPSNAEWSILYEAVGGASTAGISLKSTNGWYGNGNGKDVCGFSVLPAGFRSYDGFFLDQGDYAYFWSSTEFEYSSNRACSPYFHYGNDFVYWDNGYTDDAISVRCLRD